MELLITFLAHPVATLRVALRILTTLLGILAVLALAVAIFAH